MKIKNKMLSILGAGTFIIPAALAVSCGSSKTHTDVGFVTGGDGTLSDGYFGPMFNAVKTAASTANLKADGVEVASGGGAAGQKNATENLIDAGAKVIFQPGFENSKSLLDNAIAHPNTRFVGVSYTPFITSVKGFTDVANQASNMTKLNGAANVGMMHFKMQELGFELGFLGAAEYFKANPSSTELKYSLFSAKAYQDITALLDGYIAGVESYGTTKTKTVTLVPTVTPGSNKFFTDVTVEQPNFISANKTVADNAAKAHVGLFMVGDPNALPQFDDLDAIQVADGGEFKDHKHIKVASNKNWELAFSNALKAATATDDSFKNEYHDKLHLSTLKLGSEGNDELLIYHSQDADKDATDAALKTWEGTLDSKSVYTKVDAKGNETDPKTCGGLAWLDALK